MAELYDVFMTIRHDRKLVEKLKQEDGVNLWTIACQLAAKWKTEDFDLRQDRRSYQYIPGLVAQGKYAHLAAVFCGIDGTGRFENTTPNLKEPTR